jgi:hydroxymethylpyrimidine/phosphomethylpyrimidine kinase
VLAIGGSDPSGGAGVQADLKAIHALGGYALTAVTAVTAQSTLEVRETLPLPAGAVTAQIEALLADGRVGAVKTGMLANEEIVAALAVTLAPHRLPLVVDPVLVSSTGATLLEEAAIEPLKARLLPLATLCTPNWPEAAALSGMPVASLDDARRAGERILRLGAGAVLVKGGHAGAAGQAPGSAEPAGPPPAAIDLLISAGGERRFEAPRIAGPSAHGTGCLLASAIATGLAAGESLETAIAAAKRLVTEAIGDRLQIGRGAPVVDPLHALRRPSPDATSRSE